MSTGIESATRIRVLVVDDSAFMRTALSRMIDAEPDMEVVGTANCAPDAFEKISSLDPHVVTLDVAMPGMDGLGVLRCIMTQFPRPVIMVSASTEKDAETTFAALSAGAFDYVPKQLSAMSLEITHIRADLVAKIRSAVHSRRFHLAPPNALKDPVSVSLAEDGVASVTPAVVAIGLSTGGPRALEQILPRFPADFPVPLLIVQHMPVGFTGSLAQRLNSLSSVKVREAADHDLIRAGIAYIAPAGLHMHIANRPSDSKPMITLNRRPERAEHTPSVDVLMDDVAKVFKNRAIGVIMTGMGTDGAKGMAAIFREGGLTIGQDESTCAVYGMPRACSELGVLTRIVPLSNIPAQILRAISRRRGPA